MRFWKQFLEKRGKKITALFENKRNIVEKKKFAKEPWEYISQENVIPSFCLLVVNKKCNFHCRMCNMWKQKDNPDAITLDEMKKFVLDLKTFVKEPIFIHVIGGETLLWPHTVEIIDFIIKNGFKSSITTNGYLIDDKMAEGLVATGISGIFISLDSLSEERHDYIRGTKGAYRHVMDAIGYLDKYKKEMNPELCVGITTTIMEYNIDELLSINDWVEKNEKLNAHFFNAVIQPFDDEEASNDWFKKEKYRSLWPQDFRKLKDILGELSLRKERGSKICNPPEQLAVVKEYFRDPFYFVHNMKIKCPRGDLALEVNSVGDISICFKMPPLGNVRKDNIKDIWYGDAMKKARYAINHCKEECDVVVNCFYKIENISDYISSEKMFAEAMLNAEVSDKPLPPKTCLLTVSNSCDLHCKMCDLWRKNTTEEEENKIEDLIRFAKSLDEFDSDPIEVHLIGGEPLIKEGIFDLIKVLRRQGARVVVTTSAYPIDEDMACRIADSDLSMMNFSLDSLRPEVHDYIRGVPGTFDKVMKAIDYVSKYSPRTNIAINTIILKQSIDDLVKIAKWVDGDNRIVSLYYMAVMRPFGSDLDLNWYGDKRAKIIWPDDYRRVEEAINELIQIKRSGKSKIENSIKHLEIFKGYFKEPTKFIKHYGCNLAEHAINVNAVGATHLCFFMESIGNIKEKSAPEMWYSSEAERVREKMKKCQKNCELIFNCYYEDEK